MPSPPVSLLYRLQYLEDHIIRLEKDHPPWAALHFNQPRRGVSMVLFFLAQLKLIRLLWLQWPPPPRPTPIIVPSYLTSSAPHSSIDPTQISAPATHPSVGSSSLTEFSAILPSSTSLTEGTGVGSSGTADGKSKKSKGRQKSSLHRAVLERLEVQKAMSDLKGIGPG